MPKFSEASTKHMETCHPDLIRLWEFLIEHVDFSILNGLRSVAEQEKNVKAKISQTMNSMHLPQRDGLAHANDVAPYPQKWDDTTDPKMTQWEVDEVYFAGIAKGAALVLGIDLRTGADWNGDGRNIGQGFRDLDHFEIPVH